MHPFEIWLEWLDSHDGRLYRRANHCSETDTDLAATLPNRCGASILTVGKLREAVLLMKAGRRNIQKDVSSQSIQKDVSSKMIINPECTILSVYDDYTTRVWKTDLLTAVKIVLETQEGKRLERAIRVSLRDEVLLECCNNHPLKSGQKPSSAKHFTEDGYYVEPQ